ncbi:hypothetical protein B0H21DRAFT_699945, partial [Amylocystis lapponica]
QTTQQNPNAMDIDCLSPRERDHHYKEGQCFECHQTTTIKKDNALNVIRPVI